MPEVDRQAIRIFKWGPLSSKSVLLTFCLQLLSSSGSFAASSDLELGKSHLSAKNYKTALACFDRGVDEEPTNGEFHYWRGKCLLLMGKSKEAVAEFKLGALLTPDQVLKNNCAKELAKFKLAAPQGSVHTSSSSAKTNKSAKNASESGSSGFDSDEDSAAANGKNLFKLSSKKLDWNLELRGDFLQQMKSRNENLGMLAHGSRWHVPAAAANRRPVPVDLRSALNEGPSHFTIPLSADEKNVLAHSDIIIVLDHSGSMKTLDCPASGGFPESRLSWCVEELAAFADQIASALPHGFHLISFESKPEVHRISNAVQMLQILNSLNGGGGTDLAAALKEAFRLHTAHPKEPLLIAVVTDAEIDLHSSQSAIVDATRQFPLPNGVFITLLQIGAISEIHTADTLASLEGLKLRAGAQYDAFFGIPFSRVRRDGLGRDLLFGLRANTNSSTDASSSKTYDSSPLMWK